MELNQQMGMGTARHMVDSSSSSKDSRTDTANSNRTVAAPLMVPRQMVEMAIMDMEEMALALSVVLSSHRQSSQPRPSLHHPTATCRPLHTIKGQAAALSVDMVLQPLATCLLKPSKQESPIRPTLTALSVLLVAVQAPSTAK